MEMLPEDGVDRALVVIAHADDAEFSAAARGCCRALVREAWL